MSSLSLVGISGLAGGGSTADVGVFSFSTMIEFFSGVRAGDSAGDVLLLLRCLSEILNCSVMIDVSVLRLFFFALDVVSGLRSDVSVVVAAGEGDNGCNVEGRFEGVATGASDDEP